MSDDEWADLAAKLAEALADLLAQPEIAALARGLNRELGPAEPPHAPSPPPGR